MKERWRRRRRRKTQSHKAPARGQRRPERPLPLLPRVEAPLPAEEPAAAAVVALLVALLSSCSSFAISSAFFGPGELTEDDWEFDELMKKCAAAPPKHLRAGAASHRAAGPLRAPPG